MLFRRGAIPAYPRKENGALSFAGWAPFKTKAKQIASPARAAINKNRSLRLPMGNPSTVLATGATARVHILPQQGTHPFVVLVDASPENLGFAGLTHPERMKAILTCAEGVTWPDQDGETILRGIVALRGVAALCFETLADAMSCQRLLAGAVA